MVSVEINPVYEHANGTDYSVKDNASSSAVLYYLDVDLVAGDISEIQSNREILVNLGNETIRNVADDGDIRGEGFFVSLVSAEVIESGDESATIVREPISGETDNNMNNAVVRIRFGANINSGNKAAAQSLLIRAYGY